MVFFPCFLFVSRARETDTDDNNCPGGWILVAMVGDLGSGPPPTFFAFDGVIDAFDFALWKACYDGLGPDP
jgi:hypothetical protein